ncbi:MAG: SUMF1/EgtB/PvdO family nonheme iron enzyme, partial [Planctomycetaceae bacterium]|nr:SUMF1/EgtB/PvdO family nonheme iron enzyme [Planctomycetaceae bacterium]
MKCPQGCGEMLAGELLWVCGWCGASEPRQSPPLLFPPPLVHIPAGFFWQGSRDDDPRAQPHERPLRRVWLDEYAISIYPITNDDYRVYVEQTQAAEPDHWATRPPTGIHARHPVCFVTWNEAMNYCRWISEVTGTPFSLPTEAQWEKAARGGEWLDGDAAAQVPNPHPQRTFPHGRPDLLSTEANFAGVCGGTTPIGVFSESISPYQCFDMVGNVSEWCWDTYDAKGYHNLPETNPRNESRGDRVVRGGSWRSEADHARCSNRYFYNPDRKSYGIGFRIVQIESAPTES